MNKPKINKIYTLGEVVFDIMFKNGQSVAAKPGGSMLNASVSLGRSGLPVSFTGTCGKDKTGELIAGFLRDNRVDTTYLHHEDAQSIIALAFLDKNNNASYSFYKGSTPPEEPPLPETGQDDVVLFGSFYSISPSTRNTAIRLRNMASGRNSLIIYDPNFRDSHLSELESLRPFIEENISHSDIVRGSDEDFEIIFGARSARSTWSLPCFKHCSALIYTRSAKGVDLFTKKFSKHYPVPSIRPVSTIGAGDSFNAGVIAAMYENNISSLNVNSCNEGVWDKIIEKGAGFSSAVCMSYDNYIPFP
ncbi:MAG: PfkB family carbohydrate kinase [Bacteroidales bacterium]